MGNLDDEMAKVDFLIEKHKKGKKKKIIKSVLLFAGFALGGLGIIGIILLILPNESLNYEPITAGVNSDLIFQTGEDVNSLTFLFTHSSGEETQINGVKSGSDWLANNVQLMQSGTWTLEIKSGPEVLYEEVLNVEAMCSLDADCNGVCCSGVCLSPACDSDNDCDDGDYCTTNECVNPSTCSAFCNNDEITSFIDDDNCCPGSATLETDNDCTTCPENEIICNNSCVIPVCDSDSDCDDSVEITQDVCNNPGTCSASCFNVLTGCNEDNDCNNSKCCNNECIVPSCSVNFDCDDSNPLTLDTCLFPGECNATCNNALFENCTTNQDCVNGICCDDTCTIPVCNSSYTEFINVSGGDVRAGVFDTIRADDTIYFSSFLGVYVYNGSVYFHSNYTTVPFSKLEYDNEVLYGMSGINGEIFSYNGTGWEIVINESEVSIYDFTVSDSDVYAAGSNSTEGIILHYNGTENYIKVADYGIVWDIEKVDDKLVIYLTDYEDSLNKVYYFNGTDWILTKEYINMVDEVEDMIGFNSHLYLGTSEGKVWKTNDFKLWEGVTLNDSASVYSIFEADGRLYAGVEGGDIYFYSLGEWYKICSGLYSPKGVHVYNQELLIFDLHGIYTMETIGCSKYCINQGTCTAGCVS